jgi:hypothetical protein
MDSTRNLPLHGNGHSTSYRHDNEEAVEVNGIATSVYFKAYKAYKAYNAAYILNTSAVALSLLGIEVHRHDVRHI